MHKIDFPRRRKKGSISAGTYWVDEGWQLSKDSADSATAFSVVVREKGKSRIKTVTEVLLSPKNQQLLCCQCFEGE